VKPDNRLNEVLFNGEAMHSDTDKAMVLAGIAGLVIGTISPSAPVEHAAVKLGLASVAAIAAVRIHPGAEKIARDWQRREENEGEERW